MKPLKASLALLALAATMAVTTTTEARIPRFLQDKFAEAEPTPAAAEPAPIEVIPIAIARPIEMPEEERPARGGKRKPRSSYASTKITCKPKNDMDFLRYAMD